MALFEIVFSLPVGANENDLVSAARIAGYRDVEVRPKDVAGTFGLIVAHPDSKFELGLNISKLILPHLPGGSEYRSHVLAASIQEMSEEDLELLLKEIESTTYGLSAD